VEAKSPKEPWLPDVERRLLSELVPRMERQSEREGNLSQEV